MLFAMFTEVANAKIGQAWWQNSNTVFGKACCRSV